jgi:hypothetical protein
MGVVMPPNTTLKQRRNYFLGSWTIYLFIYLVFSPLQTIKYKIKDKTKKDLFDMKVI